MPASIIKPPIRPVPLPPCICPELREHLAHQRHNLALALIIQGGAKLLNVYDVQPPGRVVYLTERTEGEYIGWHSYLVVEYNPATFAPEGLGLFCLGAPS